MFNLLIFLAFLGREQPPPRGCVLKLLYQKSHVAFWLAAASARLCVETSIRAENPSTRLAAASARLCVETILSDKSKPTLGCSRLRAAVC